MSAKSPPKSSRDLPGQKPESDTQRESEQSRIKDADKTEVSDRDRIHGDGDEIGLDESMKDEH